MRDSSVRVQVAILGGGPAGCATALTLLHSGFSVVLIDGSRFPLQRGEVLPGSVRSLLELLHVWPEFLKLEPVRITEILSAWGSPSIWINDLSLHPFGCSWAVRRDTFDQMLRQAVVRAGGMYLHASVKPARHENGWLIESIPSGAGVNISADFVVDATGTVSAFARSLGVRKHRIDKLLAFSTVVATRSHAFSFSHSLLVESCAIGWWYSTPLPNFQCCVSFLTDSSEPSIRGLHQPDNWQRAVSSSRFMKEQLRICEPVVTVNVMPAFSASLSCICGNGWSAVGDAASSVDPLCGAGVARALESGIECAKCIGTTFDGRANAMQDYEIKQRRVFTNAGKMRSLEYTRECQWPNHRFWTSRRNDNSRLVVNSQKNA